MDWLEEQVYTGRANGEEVAKYKNMSLIERQNPQFKPINRAMLQEIAEGIESGRLGRAIGSRIRGPETGVRILAGKRRANPGPAIAPDQAGRGSEELTRA